MVIHPPIHSRRPRRAHPAAVLIFVLGVAALAASIVWSHARPGARLGGGAVAAAERAPGAVRIVVTIPPLLWPVREMAPEGAEITLLAPPGAGCEGVEMTPGQVVALERADLVVMVGLGREGSVQRMLEGHDRPFVSMDSALGAGETPRGAGSQDGASGEAAQPGFTQEPEHGSIDPHAWLDPAVMREFSVRLSYALADAVARAGGDERDAARVAAGLERVVGECRAVDQEYAERLRLLSPRVIVTQHNAFGYVARRYGLKVAAVIRPMHDVEPTPGDLQRAAQAVRENHLGAVFVEPQLAPDAARRIAEVTGARVLTLDPLGDGDWPAMMRRNLAALVEGLSASR